MSVDRDIVGPDFVQSLERGLAVICAFDAEHSELTLSEVARATDLTRAAARRFLLTLVALGYLRTDGHVFALQPRILELGYAYLSSAGLPEIAQPHMEALTGRVGESCSMSVLDDGAIVYIARVPTRRIMHVAINVGTRFPAYATSMGRVLLAGLAAEDLEQYLATATFQPLTPRTIVTADGLAALLRGVARQGWCFVDQELELGLRSIAVPLHQPNGRVAAALNVSTPATRGSAEEVRRDLLPELRATAAAIEADIARTPTLL